MPAWEGYYHSRPLSLNRLTVDPTQAGLTSYRSQSHMRLILGLSLHLVCLEVRLVSAIRDLAGLVVGPS